MSTCQGLSPPPQTLARHRASSTNLGSASTLSSLGRRRSSSFLQANPTDEPAPSPAVAHPPSRAINPITTPPPPPSILVIFASRFLEWMHVQPKHKFSWSTPSSPRSSVDDLVLPLSASAHKTSFGEDVHEVHEVVPEPNSWRRYVRNFQ